jgi:hypothetical protein
MHKVQYPPPGANELRINILDASLMSSLWLREKQYVGARSTGTLRSFRFLRVAAISIASRKKGISCGRIWYLRPEDQMDLTCPAEAVVPSTIGLNSQSEPYLLRHPKGPRDE